MMGEDTETMAGAWKLLDRIQADERIKFLPEPQGLVDCRRVNITMLTNV